MANDFNNDDTIAIFRNDVDNEKAPSHTGNLVLSRELVKYAMAQIKAGEDAKIRVALWAKVADSGVKYLQGVVQEPQEGKAAPTKKATVAEDEF